VGAVMGSKNLKAIAVLGTKEPKLSDSSGFAKAVKKTYTSYANQKSFAKDWKLYGTASMVDILEPHGNWPTRNFQSGVFPESRGTLYSKHWRKSVRKDVACAVCPVMCKKVAFTGSDGPFAGIVAEGLEYETIWAFGSQCGNIDLKAVTAADKLCDELGLDTISAGNVIGFAMELYQNKIITSKDTGGAKLEWGDAEAMVEMVNKIAYRTGIGNILAEGVAIAAKKIKKGSEKYAMHVKGLELPGYDPRGQFGMGLNYATANRGGCHCTGYTTFDEVTGPIDPFSAKGKGELIHRIQNEAALRNSVVLCTFGEWITKSYLRELLRTATGLSFTKDELDEMGERIFNLERAFNVREGFTGKDDTLPKRLLKEPLKEGKSKAHVVELGTMLRDYYGVRGWDLKTGIPSRKKLEGLGLSDVAKELKRLRKLPS
ncbi:MAG: aldehyde ferredoxin oxidoreductase C-terminal domain-containing protein, partial [Methanobacteriota archaeon]